MSWWHRGEAHYAVIDTDDGACWTVQRWSRDGLWLTDTWVFADQADALREVDFQRLMDRERYDEGRLR